MSRRKKKKAPFQFYIVTYYKDGHSFFERYGKKETALKAYTNAKNSGADPVHLYCAAELEVVPIYSVKR